MTSALAEVSVLDAVAIPSLIALAVALAPRAAWHGHRRDLPMVESWGVGAALAAAFLMSFRSVAGDAGATGIAASAESLTSVMLVAGLGSVILWGRMRAGNEGHPSHGAAIESPIRASPLVAMVLAFASLLLLRTPCDAGLASRLPDCLLAALLAMAFIPAARRPSPLAVVPWILSIVAIAIVADASSIAFMAIPTAAMGATLVLLTIPMAINRRFIVGSAGASVAAAALVSLAALGSGAACEGEGGAGIPAWCWWACALAPGAAVVPSILHISSARRHVAALAGIAITCVILAAALGGALARR